jgi:TolB-like protein/class 3 adenylate cyclase
LPEAGDRKPAAQAVSVADANDSHLELAHVLFIDIVGYSKLLSDEQKKVFELLNEIVRGTAQFQSADAAGKLVRVPTGDGMVLAFFTSVDAPVRCAREISGKLRDYPVLKLRMGINSGPVDEVRDVNDRPNITGAGINLAQRVMDCGDAGHILLSKRVADDLAQYSEWKSYLHDLGVVEVKHGIKLPIVNFFADDVGSSQQPEKIARAAAASKKRNRTRFLLVTSAAVLLLLSILAGAWIWQRRAALAAAYETGAAGIVEKSIAVLPFDNFDDKENAYFADGVQDDILTDLAKVAELKVISRRSVAQYRGSTQSVREIGRALQVAYVLEGTVRKAAGKIRVTAQLIDTRTEAEKWAEKYERNVADVFAIQSDISQSIVGRLKAALSPAEKSAIDARPTQDEQAYDLYLRARALIHQGAGMTVKIMQGEIPRAITLLESAIERDPNFTLAYCLLSEAHLQLFGLEFYNYERLPKAKAAADAALSISPNSGEGRLAIAQYLYRGMHDREAAAKELAQAAASLPGDVNVCSLGADIAEERGQWREAVQQRRKSLELDPRDADTALALVELEISLRWYGDAEKLIDQMLATLPQQSTGPFWTLKGRIALARGDTKAAMAAYDSHPRRNAGSISVNTSVANVLFLQRQYDKAEEILRSVEDVARAHDAMPQGSDNAAARGTTFLRLGTMARATGQQEKARGYFETARTNSDAWLAKNPQQASIYEARAMANIAADDAALGRKDEALREAQHVVELWPTTRNAVVAADIAPTIATAYMWAGERESALRLLEQFAKVPYGPSAGDLKLNPVWDELRGDSRFKKIVESAAQPTAIN